MNLVIKWVTARQSPKTHILSKGDSYRVGHRPMLPRGGGLVELGVETRRQR